MFPKPYFDYGSKSIFAYFTVISCLIHLIVIFSAPSINHLFVTGFDPGKYSGKSDIYVIEIEFESDQDEGENEIDEEMIEEMEKTLEKFLEKKHVFVDTSGLVGDEDPLVDTDKVGEKGSIAKDMYLGEDGVNNEPRLTEGTQLLAKAPNELTAVKPEASGFPIEVVEEVQPLIEEEVIEEALEIVNSEMLQTNDEVEAFPEPPDVFEEQKEKSVEVKDTILEAEEIDVAKRLVELEPATQEHKSIETKEKEVAAGAADIIIEISEKNAEMATVLVDKMEDKVDAEEANMEKIVEVIKKYTETVSASMDRIKEITKDIKLNITDKTKKNIAPPVSQNSAPYFEDNISNASVKGEESFNIKKHEYASYYKHIRDRITRYWLIQFGTDASIRLATKDYKPVIVKFKVIPSGRIVEVVVADSAGNELLSSKVQRSIQNTVLKTFPDYIDEEYIKVKFNFYFF